MPTALYGGDWSYSGDPTTSSRDEVRFWMQDVDPDVPLMADTEVDYLVERYLERYGSPVLVAAVACEVLAAKMAKQVPVSADGVSVGLGELQNRYNTLAQSLRDTYKAESALDAVAIASGTMIGERRDPTIQPLTFGTGMHDNFRVGRQDYGDYHPGQQTGQPGYDEEYGAVGESSP